MARKVSRLINLETRVLNIKELNAEVRLIVHIYNEAWAQNWGFMPITDEEADAIADTLRLIIDPGLCRFAYIDGKTQNFSPSAFIFFSSPFFVYPEV